MSKVLILKYDKWMHICLYEWYKKLFLLIFFLWSVCGSLNFDWVSIFYEQTQSYSWLELFNMAQGITFNFSLFCNRLSSSLVEKYNLLFMRSNVIFYLYCRKKLFILHPIHNFCNNHLFLYCRNKYVSKYGGGF